MSFENMGNTLPQEKPNIIEARIESDTRMAEELKQAGYISEYEIYKDSHAFATKSIESLSPELQGYYEILVMQMQGPILKDTIEDNDHGVINKVPRQEIRDTLNSNGPLYQFYESNKLQQSNVANILSILEAVRELNILSPELKTEIEEITVEFAEPKEGEERSPENIYGLSHPRYKYVLNNQGRYEFVRKLEDLTERVMLQIIKPS